MKNLMYSLSTNKNNTIALYGVICLIGTVSLTACQQTPDYNYLSGETMGTSYHISYQLPDDVDETAIQAAIDKRLQDINDSMSTYQADSTISKFNQLGKDTPIAIDSDFSHVLEASRQVYQQSGGAFDPTVMPLIETWGFGSTMTVERLQSPPTALEIAQAKALVDFESVVQNDNGLIKTKDGIELDFSAVAKGYGVDVIADVLKNNYKIRNYMVEIGGEIATSGVNNQQQPWQIAIDAPIDGSTVSERQTITAIRQPMNTTNQMHLATSGNYRNSVVFNGKHYSHTIDPTTGKPIVGGAPSVTVAADSVALADAWATALTAMPYEKALKVAKEQNLAALFVILADGIKPSDSLAKERLDSIDDWQLVQTPAMMNLRADKQP
ncbi:FAD:protein FMN transferase [Psychrobacter sp. Sarcosine-3u-12]|uniref:FAD:protein FMN transferase n=1 Tax=Psychrobacter sp. Sarcosine-3u-12 TaxID=2058325 RepID=UPI000C345B87|nr:FAD:protein FMN transferase [Psychrobacter sp. Sarcosine-3u-12]PKG34995.1 thiamine biosynthesis protein [Psychrobacter sp. Sarcosine-3u-12]